MAVTNLGKVSVTPKGAWSSSSTYEFLDIVTNNGSSYLAVKAVPAGTALSNTTYWLVIASKGDKGDTGETGPKGDTGDTGNGIASIEKTSASGLVDTYTVTMTDGTTTTFTVTNASSGVWGSISGKIEDQTDLANVLAPTFSTSTAYNVGDYCFYQGALYRFVTAKSAGAWDASCVESAVITEDMKGLQSSCDDMVTSSQETAMTATQNYTAGALIIANGTLYRATANIANGAAITVGTNAEAIDLETLIAEKAEQTFVAKLPFISSSALYNATADFHNAIPRGKDITSYFTDGSLWNRINGAGGYSLFEDLYVGDYMTVGGQSYMIVDFDYYIRCGDGMDITQHHLVMMPTGNMNIPEGTALYKTDPDAEQEYLTLINTANYREHTGDDTASVSSQETAVYKKWNATMDAPNTSSTAGGYKYSRMRQVIMKAADTIIVNAFGSAHIKPIPVLYPSPANAEASGLASNWTWFKSDDWSAIDRKSICDLPNETQIYGQQVWGVGTAWNTSGYEVGVDKWQFALFKNNRARVNIRAYWWLRSVYSATYACNIYNSGYAYPNYTASAYGVRPRFLLVG